MVWLSAPLWQCQCLDMMALPANLKVKKWAGQSEELSSHSLYNPLSDSMNLTPPTSSVGSYNMYVSTFTVSCAFPWALYAYTIMSNSLKNQKILPNIFTKLASRAPCPLKPRMTSVGKLICSVPHMTLTCLWSISTFPIIFHAYRYPVSIWFAHKAHDFAWYSKGFRTSASHLLMPVGHSDRHSARRLLECGIVNSPKASRRRLDPKHLRLHQLSMTWVHALVGLVGKSIGEKPKSSWRQRAFRDAQFLRPKKPDASKDRERWGKKGSETY